VLRHLGPTAVGQLGVALAVTGLVRALSGIGLDAVLPQRVAVSSPTEIRNLLSSAARARLVALLLLVPIQIGFVWTSHFDSQQTVTFILIGFGVLGGPLEVGWWYLLGRGQVSGAVPWRMASTVLFVVARVVALWNHSGLEVFAALSGLELIVPELVVLAYAKAHGLSFGRLSHDGSRTDPSRSRTSPWLLFRSTWQFGLGGLCFIALQRVDLLIVNQLLGTDYAGRYSAIQRLCDGPLLLCSVVVVIAGPAIASEHEPNSSGHRSAYVHLIRRLIAIAVGAGLGLSILASTILRIVLGPKFSGLGGTFTIYLWSIVPVYVAAATSRLLIDVGKQNRILVNGLSGIVVSVPLTIVLLPRLGIQGAAWANTIAYSISMITVPFFDPHQREVAGVFADIFRRDSAGV
jgi:O-antigen/teichoic acid export membrane protein